MLKDVKYCLFSYHFQGFLKSQLLLGVMLFSVFFGSQVAQAEFGSIVDIGLAGDMYMTDDSANNGQGYVNLLIQNTWSDSQLWVDVGAGGLVGDTATSYVKIPQIFYKSGKSGDFQFIGGRFVHEWSALDDFWNMGLTQPLFKWNEAVPEKQGLTGLFFKIPVIGKDYFLNLFASPLFIPSQGASYEITNGKLTSSNPWFRDPVQTVDINGNQLDANFDVDLPKTQEIVFQGAGGVQFGTARNKKDFLFNAFYLDKPANDLILPIESPWNLSSSNIDVTVIPRVGRHRLLGTDVGWNFGRYNSILSFVHESEIEYKVPGNTTYPLIPEQNIFSFTQMARITRSQRIWIGYIKVQREENQSLGVFSASLTDLFRYRNRFEEAIRVKWEGLLFKALNRYRVRTAFAYNQSLQRDNIWLSADFKWSVYKGFELTTHCDFFGGSEQEVVRNDFMSAFQNNDRCLVGGHYAF